MNNFEYYEIVNTIDEYKSSVSARWKTLELAKSDMINHCDWYLHKGTGRIIKVVILVDADGKISVNKTCVYENKQ